MTTTPTRHNRLGSARLAGAGIAALALTLIVGSVIVLKQFLASPSATQGSPSTAAGGAASTPASIAEALDFGRRAMAASNYAEATATLLRAIEAAPLDQELRLAAAEAFVGQQRFADAYQQMEKALAIGPKTAALHFQAGTYAAKANLFDLAVEQYSMAQTADPAKAEYPLYLAMVYLRLDPPQTQAAAASLLRVVQLQPDRAEAWGTLGELYFMDDKLTIAQQNIEKARALNPNELKWRLIEARILNRQNEPQKAATSLLALDKSQQYRPEVLKVLGQSYGLLGKPAEAAALHAAAAATPTGASDPNLNYQTALWFDRAKDPATALKYAKAAALLGNADAKDLATRLESRR